MRICGLITEYNPFHNGHLYHASEAKRQTGADVVVAVMSGHFLQRGEPAMMDKWQRAKAAVEAGIDLVIELPVYYSTASAEMFAYGAVALLDRLGADVLCFGSESGDISSLMEVAAVIDQPSDVFDQVVRKHLDEGLGYHVARAKAVDEVLGVHYAFSANNILGIEYIRAVNRLESAMEIATIRRIGNDYNDKEILSPIASATAIRELFKFRPVDWETLRTTVPQTTFDAIYDYSKYTTLDDFHTIFNAVVLREGPSGLRKYRDVKEGLENKIVSSIGEVGGLEATIEAIKSKRYTRTRIQRMITSILLGIEAFEDPYTLEWLDYARVLAFNEQGSDLIRHIKKTKEITILTNLARDLKKYRKNNPLIELDIRATGMYSQVNHSINMRSDYVMRPIKVE